VLLLAVLHNRERAAMRGQRRVVQLAVCLAALLLVSGANGYSYRQLLADGAADPAGADPADQPLYSLVRSLRHYEPQREQTIKSGTFTP
jgi:hypothetical protein